MTVSLRFQTSGKITLLPNWPVEGPCDKLFVEEWVPHLFAPTGHHAIVTAQIALPNSLKVLLEHISQLRIATLLPRNEVMSIATEEFISTKSGEQDLGTRIVLDSLAVNFDRSGSASSKIEGKRNGKIHFGVMWVHQSHDMRAMRLHFRVRHIDRDKSPVTGGTDVEKLAMRGPSSDTVRATFINGQIGRRWCTIRRVVVLPSRILEGNIKEINGLVSGRKIMHHTGE
jgi:hypothetical protein